MKTSEDLARALRSIDHKSYPAYKQLAGRYRFDGFVLVIDHVQGDPFAAPSSVHVEISHAAAGFPERYRSGSCQRRALADYLTRQLAARFERCSFKAKGSGKSGLVSITRCGQEVLERSACEILDEGIVARFHVGFPAFGRTINAEGLGQILLDAVPRCVRQALCFQSLDARQVEAAVFLAEDQEALRAAVRDAGLVAFVADGAVLPRESGVSDKPLRDGKPFVSPESMRRTFQLPHAGKVSGMAVPKGITLIVGGGYHGKSTLLEALQASVYDHVAADGREYVVADQTAIKLRAEDGRVIRDVDISPFIGNLPNGKSTTRFSTPNASGSTSQAAAVMEGIEAGARLLLIDEDTSATNFMVRDELMQQVIARDKEPITPFLERARDLYQECGISTILVAGSSGAFFRIADIVVQMDCYEPADITNRVRRICDERGIPTLMQRTETCTRADASCDTSEGAGGEVMARGEEAEVGGFSCGSRALPVFGKHDGGCGGRGGSDRSGSGDRSGDYGRNGRGGRGSDGRGGDRDSRAHRSSGGRGGRGGHGSRDERLKIRVNGCDSFSLGKANVDIRLVEQITDPEQTSALAYLLRYMLENPSAVRNSGSAASTVRNSGSAASTARDGGNAAAVLRDAERDAERGAERDAERGAYAAGGCGGTAYAQAAGQVSAATQAQAVAGVLQLLEQKGWKPFCGSYVPCGLAKPRAQELFACLNRLRLS